MILAGYHPSYRTARHDRSLLPGSLAVSGVIGALAVLVAALQPAGPGAHETHPGAHETHPEVHGTRASARHGPREPTSADAVVVAVDLDATCTRVVTDLESLHTALLTSAEGEVFCLRGPDNAPMAISAVAFAKAALGTPYVWGGNGRQDGGFDCSGLTASAYAAAGLRLPRTAQRQYDAIPHLEAGIPIRPGDLVFFGMGPRAVTHVGIAVSESLMINAPQRGEVVKIASWHRADLVGIARPTDLVAAGAG
jgi:cell wall-associated NlpC family hydrolase